MLGPCCIAAPEYLERPGKRTITFTTPKISLKGPCSHCQATQGRVETNRCNASEDAHHKAVPDSGLSITIITTIIIITMINTIILATIIIAIIIIIELVSAATKSDVCPMVNGSQKDLAGKPVRGGAA